MSKHPFEYYLPYTTVKNRRGYVNYDGRTWNKKVWRCVDCMAGIKKPCGDARCEILGEGQTYFSRLRGEAHAETHHATAC